ncbi:30S ribosomal protein S20 [Candidatus Dojkabacteria bacterium]|nr:30S ribosomal protein S20 [Candidatus Dojkabacteria bacterium]
MANLYAAKRAIRTIKRRSRRNQVWRNKITSVVKGFKKSGKVNGEDLKTAYKTLDKAAKNNVIHKNKAARLKSRLAKASADVKSKPSKSNKA